MNKATMSKVNAMYRQMAQMSNVNGQTNILGKNMYGKKKHVKNMKTVLKKKTRVTGIIQ